MSKFLTKEEVVKIINKELQPIREKLVYLRYNKRQLNKNIVNEKPELIQNMRGLYGVLKNSGWNLEQLEIFIIRRALEMKNFNKTKAAEELGISWQALDRKMIKYNIQNEKKRRYRTNK